MEQLIQAVMAAIERAGLIEVEVSARHVHLSRDDIEKLFGKGSELTPKRPLSQPGQYLSEERVTLVGPRAKKERVAVLGPARSATQVELSRSDCVELGVKAPLRESGDTAGSGAIVIEGPNGVIEIKEGVIVAQRHGHMTPAAASALGLADKERVAVEVLTERPVTFEDVVVRVSDKFSCRMHIVFDEANAAFVDGFTLGRIKKKLPEEKND